MTKRAILGHRGMLPDVGTALLGVTLVTGIVERLSHELVFGGGSMRAVTTGAVHLALEERVRECLQRLAALQLMAVKTDFGLCRRMHDVIARGMTDVTVSTGNLVVVVRPAMPAKTDIGIVTIKAYAVLHADLGRRVRAEVDDRRALLSPPDSFAMVSTRSVTSFALQLPVSERAAGI